MLTDRVALDGVEVEVFAGVFQRRKGMAEAVQPVGRVTLVPIVEKKVVQQCAAGEAEPIDAQVQHIRQIQRHARDVGGMGIAGRAAVLDEVLLALHFGRKQNIRRQIHQHRRIMRTVVFHQETALLHALRLRLSVRRKARRIRCEKNVKNF